jgi:hypothetical protein
MPQFVQVAMFVITFLLVLATIRKFLMITGYERFSAPREDLMESYRNFALYAAVCGIAGTLGIVFNQVLIATVVVMVITAIFYAMASAVYNDCVEAPA